MNIFDFSAKKGDTFNGLFFQLLINNVAKDLTEASIRADFKKSTNNNIIALTMDTANNKIEITDAVDGRFRINPQVINLPAGDYLYDIQFTFSDGSVKTYIGGKFTVIQDVTI